MRCSTCGQESDDGQHFRCAPAKVEPQPAALAQPRNAYAELCRALTVFVESLKAKT